VGTSPLVSVADFPILHICRLNASHGLVASFSFSASPFHCRYPPILAFRPAAFLFTSLLYVLECPSFSVGQKLRLLSFVHSIAWTKLDLTYLHFFCS
jgi:hypothetical protein